ncbi:unnamed protein product [Mytilus edulis]|uniref:Uncharacterized protein n=1 Tax=Mytilus edulis TaxID=6550 RepID=A0A8S3PPY3_MYTED|nr:unnamed protein product [Mytilus edulis]
MWSLLLNLFLLLNSDSNFVTSNYILNSKAVTWTAAQNICDVPSVGKIMHTTNKAYTNLPENFTAWTSSTSSTSDWTSFHGCLDVTVKNVSIKGIETKLNEYFPNSPNATTFKSVFECAYFCTGKGDIFTFVRQICKCIYQSELKLDLVMQPVCIVQKITNWDNVEDVYSMSHSSLPIFKFETGFLNMSKQKDGSKRHKHHCLARSINETLTDSDCRSKKNYYCVSGANGNGVWSYAINICLFKNSSLSNDRRDNQDYWLGYFMYEEYEEDEQCVAIQRNNISASLTKTFRPCSEHLSVLCNDEQNSVETITPVFANTNTTNLQRHDETNGEMIIVNVVLFGLCVFIITLIIFRKRLSAKVCQTAGKKFRRNKSIENKKVQKNRNSDADNEHGNRAVRDSYNDPWELRHNIVQQDELNQQDIIDVSIEETET